MNSKCEYLIFTAFPLLCSPRKILWLELLGGGQREKWTGAENRKGRSESRKRETGENTGFSKAALAA
jgi:hypothetical protein